MIFCLYNQTVDSKDSPERGPTMSGACVKRMSIDQYKTVPYNVFSMYDVNIVV